MCGMKADKIYMKSKEDKDIIIFGCGRRGRKYCIFSMLVD
jgi:hypothetical protein